MKRGWREFKIFFFVFIILAAIFFVIFNGAAFASLLKYKSKTLWQSFKNELLRPPRLAFWQEELKRAEENQKALNQSNNREGNIFSPKPQNSSLEKYPQFIKDEISKNPNQNLLIMPQFEIAAPIQTVESYNLSVIYKKLRQGVVLFPSSQPLGEGQTIIIGHSSAYPWEPGRYKSVFSLLSQYHADDQIYVWWQNNLYVYKVVTKKIFLPWPKGNLETEHLFPPQETPTLILQSCWPVGVDSRRIAVLATLVETVKNTANVF